MKLLKTEIEKKAIENARKLLVRATKNEPQITADLHKTATKASAQIIGLEHNTDLNWE